MLESLLQGFITLMQPLHLLFLLLAVFIGFVGGAMPGISGPILIIILLPLTYGMDTIPVFILLTAIYSACVFSGMISAILFKTPGTPESIATVFDGYPMAQRGEPGRALGIAILSSCIGGTIGTIFLIFLTPLLADFALKFSSPEYFALAILGLTVVASLSGGDLIRGSIGVLIGLFIATIGLDNFSGADRFTFGSMNLRSGIEFVAILIGLFALPEVMKKSKESFQRLEIGEFKTKIFEFAIFKKIYKTIARSSLIGMFIGILPGVGATTAALLGYSETVRWSKNPEKFGKGAPEGIAAPESANNCAAMGAMVPLLSLGIPGSATTAVILGAFILHGLQPGPSLFQTESALIYAIFAGLLLVNVLMLILAVPFIKVFAQAMRIPFSLLGPIILLFCLIGAYSLRNSLFDVWIMFICGIIGYFLEKIKFPIATVILGLVLGPIAEQEFRRALQISSGDVSIFFTRPISAILLALALLSILYPLLKSVWSNKRKPLEESINSPIDK